MGEEKTRDQLLAEMMEKTKSTPGMEHLTEVAKPGVYEPLHVEDEKQ